MITFQWLWAFFLLPLPLLAWLALPAAPTPKAGALKVPFFRELRAAGLVGGRGGAGHLWRGLLLTLIWLLLVTAAARPTYVGPPIAVPVEGRDLMLAVDLSGSMARQDFSVGGVPMDRLSVVKAVADDFIARRVGDRVGLILFGTRAYVQAPLTFDRNVVRELLAASSIGMTGQETAIGDAIGLAIKTLRNRPDDQRVLILLTDGANTAGMLNPLQAAELAAREHVKIYTIGVGADPRAMNPWMVNMPSDLDEDALRKIAAITGGRYFRARDVQGLAGIYADIDRLEPVAGDPLYLNATQALFQWPLGAALVLSFLLGAGVLRPQGVPRGGTLAAPIEEARR
ncbi:vWA domain-containing protein [Xanthobacter agilis]|uniref:Ca-activated chloride channel family protein n=1 Tax=Xanthobacter agilis TaxID=47492 RepID=A0ABU0LF73_XANAG|nr:VWA domain-containing protein [Xanthobacter agilis]MDQ0505788.1 Ca-activated chloride channel family protein [Xanthobacter agilis]